MTNFFNVTKITDSDLKTSITHRIMSSLTAWFSPSEDIEQKAIMHKEMPFFAAFDEGKDIGFIALKVHNEYTVEIFNFGVLEKYHRKGVGQAIFNSVELYCKEKGCKFITVKTLDSSSEYEPYERTRAFYLKNGFYPLEVFPLFWNKENPCLFLAKHIV